MIEAIYTRRSIRYFKDEPLPEEALAEILRAGMQAPSPKNRQPWRFLVISGASKEAMLAAMAKGIERSAAGEGLLTPLPGYIENARFTLRAMGEAPVTVIAVNPLGRSPLAEWTAEDKINELSNVQAVGAAAENMALAAGGSGHREPVEREYFLRLRGALRLVGRARRNGARHVLRLLRPHRPQAPPA